MKPSSGFKVEGEGFGVEEMYLRSRISASARNITDVSF